MKKKTKKENEIAKEKKIIDREKMVYRKQKLNKECPYDSEENRNPKKKTEKPKKKINANNYTKKKVFGININNIFSAI